LKELFDKSDIEKKELVNIKVDDIYEETKYLPDRLAKLIPEAWDSLQDVIEDIKEAGGTLKLSDAFRSTEEQMRAHLDYKMGRKSAYSPPSGNSMHEAGRAVDIAWSYNHLGIEQDKAGQILESNGWTPIVDSFGDLRERDVSEEWHWEFRDGLEEIYNNSGYRGMVEYAIKQVENYPDSDELEEANHSIIKDIQSLLDRVGIDPGPIDGIFGPKTERAIWEFQKKYVDDSEPDGQPDLELIKQLIQRDEQPNNESTNDDVRHDVIRAIDSLISDFKTSKDDLSELKKKVLRI
jgi:hypothetical protein